MTPWRPRVVRYAPPGGTTRNWVTREESAACGISLGLRLHLHAKHPVTLSDGVPVGSAIGAGARASAEQAYHRYQVHLHGYLPLPWLTAPGRRSSHGEKRRWRRRLDSNQRGRR